MAHTFVLNDFVRHATLPALSGYCKANEIDFPFDIARTDKEVCDEITGYFLTNIPPEQLGQLQSELAQINELAEYAGVAILIQRAKEAKVQLPDNIVDLAIYDQAIWFFLHSQEIFLDTITEYQVEHSVGWRPALLPKIPTEEIKRKKDELGQELRQYLLKKESKGQFCSVKTCERNNKIFLVAYPQGYTQMEMAYKNSSDLDREIRKPVSKIFFWYDPETGILRVKSPGGKSRINDYKRIFAKVMTGREEFQNAYEYDLNLLKDPNFPFPVGPDVEMVKVKGITLLWKDGSARDIIDVYDNTKLGLSDIHGKLERMHIPFDMVDIGSVTFYIKFKNTAVKHRKGQRYTVTVRLTSPSGDDLSDTYLDNLTWEYLQKWGLAKMANEHAA